MYKYLLHKLRGLLQPAPGPARPNLFSVGDRRTGRTTRRVDALVQQLFASADWEVIDDHHPGHEAAKHLLRILERRIDSEHGLGVKLQIKPRNGYFMVRLVPRHRGN